jgi:phosphate transport system substrate-binding protein
LGILPPSLINQGKPVRKIILAAAITATINPVYAAGRDTISIVGSSTVYPFATVVAETYGKKTGNNTPKIESTGSGGGMKLFCAGDGINTPDITNASRRMKTSEFKKCHANRVADITEALIGFDGIVMANSNTAPRFELTHEDIFLALAKNVPATDGSQTLIPNPNITWKDVNASLPAIKIEVLGPPPTSGTRDAFAELALEGGCKKTDWIKAMKKIDKPRFKAICHSIREDGAYIEAGENDNLIVQKLIKNADALGVFGYSFLEENADKIQGSLIDGMAPEFESIASGDYPVSRPLYFYIKNSHVGKVPGIMEFTTEFMSEDASGEEGYLVDRGLIPLSQEEHEIMKQRVTGQENLIL